MPTCGWICPVRMACRSVWYTSVPPALLVPQPGGPVSVSEAPPVCRTIDPFTVESDWDNVGATNKANMTPTQVATDISQELLLVEEDAISRFPNTGTVDAVTCKSVI